MSAEPSPPRTDRVVVESYPTYEGAQRAVDFLADSGFPVERTAIIGSDLRMVETVLGRLTRGRAALAGAGSGAWFGLLVGLLLSLFAAGSHTALVLLLSGIAYGAVFGAVFGFIGHALTGGRRDFTSRSQIVAGRYDVVADAQVAGEAGSAVAELRSRESPEGHRGPGTTPSS
ncbi:general stress protein [Streptomyces prasinopilosus]|uniref:general stress protein n=1 Tax=Streptomyces prasinopilosus TaxID=67344 RepID=UPI0006EBCC91|nr:general stress protein [Streptomyces prasinopilosus]